MDYNTKILIAEDDAKQRSAMRDYLVRTAGCRFVEEAENGEEALAKIERNRPDIIIVDVWLTKIDGLSLIKQACKMSYSPDKPPVIIMTSPISNQNIFVLLFFIKVTIFFSKIYDFELNITIFNF